MRSIVLILGIFIFSLNGFNQIEINNKKEKDRKKEQKMKDEVEKEIEIKNKKKQPLQVTGRNVFLGMSIGQSYRTIKPSETIFGKEVGPKAQEKPILSMRYQAGMQIVLFKNFMVDFGFTYTVQGEQYSYADDSSDSTYSYTNKYRYIGVPITVNGIFGGKWVRFYFGAGLTPLMFINQYEKLRYSTETGVVTDQENTIKDTRYNQFNLMAIGRIGVQVNFSKHVGFYLAPEFRYNILNTFEKQYKHIHHQMAWGIDFGFLLYL